MSATVSNSIPSGPVTFWNTPKGSLSKVGLCASGIFILLGGLAFLGLLLPHSSIGLFMTTALGTSGIAVLTICAPVVSLTIQALILGLYLKNKKSSSFSLSPLFTKKIQIPLVYLEQSTKQLSSDELLTFKLCLKKFSEPCSLDYKRKKYLVQCEQADDYFVITFTQAENHIEIHCDNLGQIIGFKLNKNCEFEAEISDEHASLMRGLFRKTLLATSIYLPCLVTSGELKGEVLFIINMCREGLKEIPELHLTRFATYFEEILKAHKRKPQVAVFFFDEGNLNGGTGVDAGGLTREYFDDLFQEIASSSVLTFQKGEALESIIPMTKKEYESYNSLPELNSQEKILFQSIGTTLMYCFDLPSFCIGRHFDDALFNAVLCLTAEEIDTPFNLLTFETKIKICRSLIEGYDASNVYARTLELLEKEELSENDLQEALLIALAANTFPEEYLNDGELSFKEFSNLENKEQLIHQSLMDHLFAYTGSCGPLGAQIAPILEIARGMKLVCYPDSTEVNQFWNDHVASIDFREFSAKIQGNALDREYIADHLILDPDFVSPNESQSEDTKKQQGKAEIEKKLDWLKEWIRDEYDGASEEELRKLIKFLTGSSSLPKDEFITVNKQSDKFTPIPQVSTCAFEMKLSPEPVGEMGCNDFTKDAFIEMLREYVLNAKFSYSKK